MLSEIPKQGGEVVVNGSVAYVPQRAWIVNDTLRHNVVFGNPYVQEKYDQVIDHCALQTDLEVFFPF